MATYDQGFFSFFLFFFQFWQHAQNLLSEYGNFTFFPPQNMVTLCHFYPKNSFVGLALPKICGENLSQKIKCCLQYE
jgi:hypothetical protein